jgi:hypothetical protein
LEQIQPGSHSSSSGVDENDAEQHNHTETENVVVTPILQPILPFIRALVQVEAVSLESSDMVQPLLMSPTHPDTQKKLPIRKVHFLSLDGSSIRPPIDRDLQSGVRQQQLIQAMTVAQQAMEHMTSDATVGIQYLIQFLTHVQEQQQHSSSSSSSPSSVNNNNNSCSSSHSHHDEYYNNIVQQCAASISKDCTPTLILATVNLMQHDLFILQQRLHSQSLLPKNDTCTASITATVVDVTVVRDPAIYSTPLHLESRLAELIGQGIRYRLRVLFNQSPPRQSAIDVNYEHRSMAYSKVHQLIRMTQRAPTDEIGSSAADDGFVSALISRALRRLYEYFGLDMIMSDDITPALSVVPMEFGNSAASRRPLPTHLRSIGEDIVTAADRDAIVADIDDATSFLKAVYAARFLYDLWMAPGVPEEVARMGGWSDIESYAATSWKLQLYQLCTADAHLVPLCNYPLLMQRLQQYCQFMECHVIQCWAALDSIATNYQIHVKRKRKVSLYLDGITKHFQDAMMDVNALPQIESVTTTV